MPISREISHNFFKKWSREMAYVLGFFAADGSMIKNNRGAHFIEFHITDKELLERIRKALKSNHKIAKRYKKEGCKIGYRLQIGSKKMFSNLLQLGFCPNKSKKLSLPLIPNKYLGDFIRGYFDGDGNVWAGLINRQRENKTFVISVGFTSGCKPFLKQLQFLLGKNGLIGGSLVTKERGFCLKYSVKNSVKLYQLMYNKNMGQLYLKRKKVIFERYLKKRGINADVV